ncbi:UDP-3-O-acyl-N-acetylglucosamine deacetylase [Neptunicoccus cionae]|uniref:UDP-3-O-acyl-N-acetylglucosamine deacetylase n=1 Tax=Neptunicoccus cionae TaxID=2035344 RepID=UPI000C77D97D|nr:UDP-3-O-acyl-N-acetylglucosamine deacetylase [Amylibacter cionae]PLS22436.1 UDP-3-O-[3-hydroxymyristoyl] N-acetylglucosamine deacetylase [Amylibacter cionae]
MQRTLKTPIEIVGKGLHSGKRAALRVSPSVADFGIWIQRVDVTDRDNMIPARYDHVNDTRLCTRLANDAGVEVSTVEHLMAALAGTGIHNAMIEIDGPEIPIMDGSSAPFVAAILKAGLKELDAPLKAIRILKPVSINVDGFSASLAPSEKIEIEFAIDFDEAAIGKQSKTLQMSNGAFVRELSNCRTFCLRRDVDMMQSAGLALGGGLENAIVVDGDTVLNPEGFRRDDECVRHKMLDALGDLALAGHPIIGRYHGDKAGHRATNLLLRELFAQPDAWEMVECTPSQWHDLPGAHIKPSDFVLA